MKIVLHKSLTQHEAVRNYEHQHYNGDNLTGSNMLRFESESVNQFYAQGGIRMSKALLPTKTENNAQIRSRRYTNE